MIAFDNAVGAGVQNSSLTQTWAHTCNGDDRLLVVFVRLNASETGITHVKYNGVTMTKSVSLSPNISHVAYYLVNPASGSNNVVVTISNSGWQIVSSSMSYTGVDQSNPIDVTASKRQTTSTISNTITTTVASTIIASGIAVNATSRTYTAEAGSTERSDAGAQATSTKDLAVAGATTTGFTGSQSSDYLLLQLALQDIEQPAGGTGNFLQFMN